MEQRMCSVEGCEKPKKACGWCSMHYNRWKTLGSLDLPSRAERFWAKVQKGQPNDCWPWLGAVSLASGGYGAFRYEGRTVAAHRAAYEIACGPIPAGMQVDHQCHNEDKRCSGGATCQHRRCVNPAHLVLATIRENVLKGRGISARNALATHCIHGHEFTPENTTWVNAGKERECRTCRKAYEARHRPVCKYGHPFNERLAVPGKHRVCEVCRTNGVWRTGREKRG